MNNSTRMHSFLQRMLKKSDDELELEKRNLVCEKLRADNFSQNKTPNWIKNLGACSPSNSELTPITRTPSRPITLLKSGEQRNDCRRKNMPVLATQKNRPYSEESPNIDQIRREFEMGFLSPTQRETTGMSSRSGLFVKKIVAAFEEKYKAHNDLKVGVKESPKKCDSSDDESSFDEEETMATIVEESTTMLSETCVIESLESRLTRYLDSYIASSSVREEDEEESPSEEETSIGQQCSPILKDTPPKLSGSVTSLNSSRKQTSGVSTPKSSPGKLVRRDSSIRRERQPKIVGAYLKKPIEVEDTSIDWIPIMGKKLPRKKSFKRLLSILTGKKSSEKSSKLYCSEMNLQEETTRELLQDSGYDEKSASSSSLTSLASINDLILQQKSQDSGIHEDERRVYNMTTFRQCPQSVAGQIDTDQGFRDDDFSSINDDDTWSLSSKKLFLEEVSRSELRLSLGPSFPSAAGPKVVCSLDRREAKWPIGKTACNNDRSRANENAPLPPSLPKNLLASLKKRLTDPNDPPTVEKTPDKVNMSFSEFEKVQLRRDFQSWKFPTEEFPYDTPRRFLSKSEPGLATLSGVQRTRVDKLPTEIVYDVPKPNLPRRPRSSIYDDALSLKRRNDDFTCRPGQTLSNEFYGFSCNREPHYATVKPRNTRINASRGLLRSVGDLNCNDTKYTDNYYGRVDAPIGI